MAVYFCNRGECTKEHHGRSLTPYFELKFAFTKNVKISLLLTKLTLDCANAPFKSCILLFINIWISFKKIQMILGLKSGTAPAKGEGKENRTSQAFEDVADLVRHNCCFVL